VNAYSSKPRVNPRSFAIATAAFHSSSFKRRARVALRRFGVGVFHIRHVNIDHAVEELEDAERLVAAAVIDEREVEAALDRVRQGGDDSGREVGGRNDVDVPTTRELEVAHRVGESRGRRLDPLSELAQVVVLAEDAREVAVGEEDRSRAVAPDERRLFAKVGTDARYDRRGARTALARFAMQPSRAALVRTEDARIHQRPQARRALAQLVDRQLLKVAGWHNSNPTKPLVYRTDRSS